MALPGCARPGISCFPSTLDALEPCPKQVLGPPAAPHPWAWGRACFLRPTGLAEPAGSGERHCPPGTALPGPEAGREMSLSLPRCRLSQLPVPWRSSNCTQQPASSRLLVTQPLCGCVHVCARAQPPSPGLRRIVLCWAGGCGKAGERGLMGRGSCSVAGGAGEHVRTHVQQVCLRVCACVLIQEEHLHGQQIGRHVCVLCSRCVCMCVHQEHVCECVQQGCWHVPAQEACAYVHICVACLCVCLHVSVFNRCVSMCLHVQQPHVCTTGLCICAYMFNRHVDMYLHMYICSRRVGMCLRVHVQQVCLCMQQICGYVPALCMCSRRVGMCLSVHVKHIHLCV